MTEENLLSISSIKEVCSDNEIDSSSKTGLLKTRKKKHNNHKTRKIKAKTPTKKEEIELDEQNEIIKKSIQEEKYRAIKDSFDKAFLSESLDFNHESIRVLYLYYNQPSQIGEKQDMKDVYFFTLLSIFFVSNIYFSVL